MNRGFERTPYDRHHVLWTRREQQKTRMNRLLRNHPGLIIPLPVHIHRDLHAEIPPPIVPSPPLAESMLSAINRQPFNEMFSAVIKHLAEVVEADGRWSEQASQLGFNFLDQAEIMGQVYRFDLQ